MRFPALSREALNKQFIELETRHPEVLSQQLRGSSDAFLRERRGVIGLSLLATTALGLISLYQMGILSACRSQSCRASTRRR